MDIALLIVPQQATQIKIRTKTGISLFIVLGQTDIANSITALNVAVLIVSNQTTCINGCFAAGTVHNQVIGDVDMT